MLRVGTEAPDFEIALNTGGLFRLSDHRGERNIALFFYPKNFTRGCTKEVCSFSEHENQIDSLQTMILGISADTLESHKKFASVYHLRFPLGSDKDRTITRLYGALFLGFRTRRVTYVIDKKGIICGLAHHEILMSNHWKSVVRILKALDRP